MFTSISYPTPTLGAAGRASAESVMLSAEKEQKDKNTKYHTCEFRYGKYKRTISFDQPVRVEDTIADYKNGVLNITLPKQKIAETKAKKLEIRDR